MKNSLLYLSMAALLFSTACDDDDDNGPIITDPTVASFTVRIENVSEASPFLTSGMFNTPVDAAEPGPAGSGMAYEFSFNAGPGQKLSFATMYVQSNDLFFAPDGSGIALYDNGMAVTGDITDQLMLWDAGTEVNEEPGVGENQAPRQSGPDTGEDENGNVQLIADVDDGFSYPEVSDIINATLSHDGGTMFTLRIAVTESSNSPIAPGVYVVHTEDNPLFTAGMPDRGEGLEALAEDGGAAMLADALEAESGVTGILSPGAWAVHTNVAMFFTEGAAANAGIEAIAEDGNWAPMLSILDGLDGVLVSGAFNTPIGAAGPGPLLPGEAYEFSFTASEDDPYLSLATMLVQSNDIFIAPEAEGIALWNNGTPLSGNISNQFLLWDAGTEVNEFPGAGPNQAPRQSGPDTGEEENGNVQELSSLNDGYSYPAVSDVVEITITAVVQ